MADIKATFSKMKEEVGFLARTVQARGAKRYGRALAISAVVLVASYKMIFVEGGMKLTQAEHDLAAAKAVAQYASAFNDLDSAFRIFMLRLPPADRAEGWLLDSVRESMKAEGLVSQTLSPVAVTEAQGYKVLSINLTFQAKFKELANWIARIEGSRQLMHVSSLTLTKSPEAIGMNTVAVTISSVVPSGGRP